jgi:hypothetical protein
MEPIVHFEQDILSSFLVFGLSNQTEQNICWIIWKEWLTKYMCINIIESFGFILDL